MPSTLIHSLPNSGLSREKPGPKPRSMVKLGLNNGRSISPTPSSPKISTYSSPRWSVAALLPSEEKEQVDQPSEPIVQKPASRFNFLIRNFVGSFQLAVYFLHAFVYKMLSCRPSHRGPSHPSRFHCSQESRTCKPFYLGSKRLFFISPVH